MNPEHPASLKLVLAAPGSGKTEATLEHLAALTRHQPLATVWCLLPGERQIEAYRRRLIERDPERRVYFNVEFFTFYALYARILMDARQPARRLDDPARDRLLRAVLLDLQRQDALQVFGTIAHLPGFVRVAGDFIYELKQNLVDPAAFAAAAATEKDADLARAYAAYQEALQRDRLVDREGEGWLALELVNEEPAPGRHVDLLLVDGFDQFNLLQARLVAALAARSGRAVVTLATVPGREGTVGRRFERARAQLEGACADAGLSLAVERLKARGEGRVPALAHLRDDLLAPEAVLAASEGRVSFVEAPGPPQEAAEILRRVKRLLLDGARPDDILVAVRDWQAYAEPLATAAEAYGLSPLLALQYAEPLAANPAMTALFDLLDLHAGDFRRRELLDVLRSPYLELEDLSGEWADLLERVSRALVVTGGRDRWLAAVRQARHLPVNADDEPEETLLSPEAATALEGSLNRFFERVTPPAAASVSAYIRWIELLIGDDPERDADLDEDAIAADVASVELIARIRRPAPPGLVERDLAAMARFKGLLRSMLATQALFDSLGTDDQTSWGGFLAELKAAVAATYVYRAPNRDGRVLVTTVTDARGLPHAHVIIPGLSEGLFPARLPENPLYLDGEREAMSARGIPLATRTERADDDGLFFELVSLARETLTLTRSYVRNGAPWPASHLWRAAARLFSDGDELVRAGRLRAGAVAPPDRAASAPEVALAVADGMARLADEPALASAYNWLLDRVGDYWSRITHGREVEWRRVSTAPYDRFSGRLADAEMVATVERLLGPGKVWSATQLNDLGTCAFRYYAGRMLGLEALQEPEEGLDALDRGSLYHDILERTYRQVGLQGLTIAPEHSGRALEILRDEARAALRDAPRRLGFQPSALWEQEKETLLRRLEMLVRDDFSGAGPLDEYGSDRVPHRLETRFGGDGEPYLSLDLGPGGRLHVRGKIDRIDRTGRHAVVVDYKSGSTRIGPDELKQGRNYQMMLYLLAAEAILAREPGPPLTVEAGVFWHIGSRDIVGRLSFDETGIGAIEDGKARLASSLARARSGDFSGPPGAMEDGKCARYCEFSTFCRVGILNRDKLPE